MSDGRAPRRANDIVQREVAGETFLVPIRGHLADLQDLFVLNEVGRWLWERLDGMCPLDDLASGVAAEFDVDEGTARRDTESFVQRLVEAELVEEVSAPVA
jgi:hypothetical protein